MCPGSPSPPGSLSFPVPVIPGPHFSPIPIAPCARSHHPLLAGPRAARMAARRGGGGAPWELRPPALSVGSRHRTEPLGRIWQERSSRGAALPLPARGREEKEWGGWGGGSFVGSLRADPPRRCSQRRAAPGVVECPYGNSFAAVPRGLRVGGPQPPHMHLPACGGGSEPSWRGQDRCRMGVPSDGCAVSRLQG